MSLKTAAMSYNITSSSPISPGNGSMLSTLLGLNSNGANSSSSGSSKPKPTTKSQPTSSRSDSPGNGANSSYIGIPQPKRRKNETPKKPEVGTPEQPKTEIPKEPKVKTPKQPKNEGPKLPKIETPKKPKSKQPTQKALTSNPSLPTQKPSPTPKIPTLPQNMSASQSEFASVSLEAITQTHLNQKQRLPGKCKCSL